MRKSLRVIVATIAVLAMAYGIAFAMCYTDYNCISDCTRKGYLYMYCKNYCTACDPQ